MSKNLDELLNYDGLHEAEKLTGISYKEDDSTSALGLLLSIQNNKAKEEALTSRGDTHFGRDMAWMREFLPSLGFALIHKHDFMSAIGYCDTTSYAECVEFYWHPEGILFKLESYCGERMNTCNAYFNWESHDPRDAYLRGASGGLNNGVMVGHIDGREGFAYFLENARKNGKFLAKWVERPFLWLLTYDEPKVEGYDYNAINAARFAQFPQHVQDAMGA